MTALERPGAGPLVSIVTPTLNRAAYLRWTINSIRNQTYPNLEHLVMDGGSADGTLDLLRAVEGAYRMRWQSKRDEGMYQAINAGLASTEGEILAYLNSDDLYFPWTIQTVVDAFLRNPDVDFIYGDALAVDDETGQTIAYFMQPFDLDFIQRIGFLAQPAVFWRRRAFEDVGPFDESLRYVADCDYWMRAGAHHRFLKVDEFLAIERLHRGTLREAIGGPLWKELERVRSKYVTLTGPDHDQRVADHGYRRTHYERRYKLYILLQSYLPKRWRRGRWSRILNSRLVKVERFRYVLRALILGAAVPGLRRWTRRAFLRADRSILEPR